MPAEVRSLAAADRETPFRERRFKRKIAWGVVDQGISSFTNFGLAILAGRLLGPSGLGVIAIGFSAYLIVLGFARSLLTEPAVIASSAGMRADRERTTRAVVSAEMLMSCLAAVVLVLVAALLGGRIARGLILFAPWLIPALLQDLWRMLLFRDGRGLAASSNDAAWFVAMALTLPVVWRVQSDTALVAWWGFGATCGAAVGFIQLRTRLAGPKDALRWAVREAWPLGRWFVAEGAVYTVASQFVVFLVAAMLGTGSVGGLRSVQVLFAPFALLGPAIALPGLPSITRALRRSSNAGWKMSVILSAILTVAAFGYLLVSLLVGEQVLSLVLGQSFGRYGNLILPLGMQQVLAAASSGFFLLLKAARRGKALLLYRSVISAATVACVAALAVPLGLVGAAWGVTAGTGLGVLILVVLSRRITSVEIGS